MALTLFDTWDEFEENLNVRLEALWLTLPGKSDRFLETSADKNLQELDVIQQRKAANSLGQLQLAHVGEVGIG